MHDFVTSRLLQERTVLLSGRLDEVLAESVVAQLLLLARSDAQRPISLVISSTGGVLEAGLRLYEVMQSIGVPIATFCPSTAADVAALVLAAGSPGKRAAAKSAAVVLQEPAYGGGPAGLPLGARLHLLQQAREQFAKALAQHTGRPLEQVAADLARGVVLGAPEAREYGLVDRVDGFYGQS